MKRARHEMSRGDSDEPPTRNHRNGGPPQRKRPLEVVIQGYGSVPYEHARRGNHGKMGRKPLEPCWICGSEEHMRKDCPHKLINDGKSVQKKLVCLGCRRRGHVLAECPEQSAGGAGVFAGASKPVCFNCGSDEHRLHECSEPKVANGTSFATCFVCNARGHLSRDCPSNKHGLYPRGGGCKKCGKTDHFVKDCPEGVVQMKEDVPSSDDESVPGAAPTEKKDTIAVANGDDLGGNLAFTLEDEDAPKRTANPKGSKKPFYRADLAKKKGRKFDKKFK